MTSCSRIRKCIQLKKTQNLLKQYAENCQRASLLFRESQLSGLGPRMVKGCRDFFLGRFNDTKLMQQRFVPIISRIQGQWKL